MASFSITATWNGEDIYVYFNGSFSNDLTFYYHISGEWIEHESPYKFASNHHILDMSGLGIADQVKVTDNLSGETQTATVTGASEPEDPDTPEEPETPEEPDTPEDPKPEGPYFEDRNITPDTEDTPPGHRDPFADYNNWPSVVFLHQQRLGYAASYNNPLTIWLSQAGNFESMAASVPPEDDDAIEVTLAASQANKILWCQSDRNGLAVGTEGGEWILTGTEGAALTPSDLSFQPQTYHGSEPGLPVLRAANALLYLQRGGRVVREYGYSFSADRYESGDLSLLARHVLRDTPIRAWAWQAEPYSIVWCVLSDGTMAGLTYMREHDVVGWHRHETSGKVLDVAAIPGEDGTSQVWFVVERDGVRRMERLAPFFEGRDGETAMHTDGQEGLEFYARCIPCMPEMNIQNGSTFLRVRKINALKCRVLHSKPFEARVGDSEPMPVPVRGAPYSVMADWALPLGAGWRDGDRLELIFDGADPVTVLGLLVTLELAELAGGQR